LRTTAEERELIDRAVIASGTDLTDFVVTHASDAARRVLADRDKFTLIPPLSNSGKSSTRDRPATCRGCVN
jgi:uncharacterized protein (DUF1778 family)